MKRIFLSILILYSLLASAGVNHRNGNFYMSYTDIEFPGSKTEMTRSYNSLTTSVGLFGYGWGTYMESRLYALPDGNLFVRWWGGGNEDLFETAAINQQGLYYMVNEIIKHEIKNGKLSNTPVEILKRKAVLASDAGLRITRYIDLVNKKIVAPWTQTSTNRKTWKRNINQVIEWDGKNYSLQSWDDQYIFIASGLLSEIIEPRTQMKLFYTNSLLSGILVDNKFQCDINTDSSGKITRLVFNDSTGKKEAFFKYDNNDNLIYSKDAGNNEYWFHYDKIHNLNRIGYVDSTFMEITYDPVTNRATRVKERNGAATVYQYPFFYTEDGKINYRHYATRIKKYDSTGVNIFNEYYEYESRLQPDGDDYLYRRLIQTDTSYDEAIYPPVVGNAIYRKLNKNEAWAAYDGKIRCIYLRIKDTVYLSSYTLLDNPASFRIIDSLRKDTLRFSYTYDNAGKLKETKKNDTVYIIQGSRKEGKITVKKDAKELIIGFKNNEPYYLQNKDWGITTIQEDTAAKEKAIPTSTALAKNESSREQINESAKRLLESALKPNSGKDLKPESGGKNNKQRLRELYTEFKEVMEPKIIPHEWIWEKL